MHARDLSGRRLPSAALLVVLMTSGCSDGTEVGPDVEQMPSLGVCRVLSPDDVARPSNASDPVDCAVAHTAETYAVGSLPDRFDDATWDGDDLGAYAYRTCATKFMKFLGADESLVMRTVLNWAWFRPSKESWDAGSRWYRCDVVGGGEQSAAYVDLPTSTEGVLLGRPDDRWLVCAAGESVDDAPKIPCADRHDWRAVTTIKVGKDDDDYPGDRLVEVRTRDFCSDSVGAWLNYPVTYDFGYTWFHEAEWMAGNRRSVCWARIES
ncbi:MAG: septum formation family protein [Nocardioides sp.]